MKNKRLTITLIILSILVFIVVLNSTVFAYKNAELFMMDGTSNFNSEDVIVSANFHIGDNIFTINKKQAINNIQKNFPYLRVINIETVFPNKLIINAVERKELFAFDAFGGGYFITDDLLFVVSKNVGNFSNTSTNSIKVETEDLQAVVSNEMHFSHTLFMQKLAYVLQEWQTDFNVLKEKIESITLNFERPDQLKLKMRSGVSILVLNASENISQKIRISLSYYNEYPEKTTQGTIEVRTDSEDDIYAIYSA